MLKIGHCCLTQNHYKDTLYTLPFTAQKNQKEVKYNRKKYNIEYLKLNFEDKEKVITDFFIRIKLPPL